MSRLAPGWYTDPAEPSTQRYWDGEGWVGDPLPGDAEPPPGPPPERSDAEPQVPPVPGMPGATEAPPGPPAAGEPDRAGQPETRAPSTWPSRKAAGGVPPEPHGHRLATPGARLLARLIDIGLVLLLNVVVNGWFVWRLWQEVSPTFTEAWQRAMVGDTSTEGIPTAGEQTGNLMLAIVFIAAALWFAYEVPAVANSGQTVGKRVQGIRVVRLETAEPLTFGRSFRRWNTMGIPTLFWPCFGIGFVLQLVDAMFVPLDRPLHQALHDKSAHTAVVTIDSHQEAPDEPVDST